MHLRRRLYKLDMNNAWLEIKSPSVILLKSLFKSHLQELLVVHEPLAQTLLLHGLLEVALEGLVAPSHDHLDEHVHNMLSEQVSTLTISFYSFKLFFSN